MTDLLDNLGSADEEDLDGELILPEEEDSEDTLVIGDLDEMTENEAIEITAAIRSTVTATYVLLTRAHEGKAYKALGYESWKEYISGEFDFSVQRSYQLLDLGRTVELIESAAPEGTDLSLTEAQARDIKRELPKITEKVKEETAGKTPEEAAALVDNIIEDAREQKKADEKVLAEDDKKRAEKEQDEENARLEREADALLEPDVDTNLGDSASDDYVDISVDGEGTELSKRDTMALYNFFNILSGFESLPEASEMLALIPKEREEQVESSLLEITGWFNSFHTLWDERNED